MYYILHESMDCNFIFYNDWRIVGSGDIINFLCNEKGSLFNCHINLITTRLLHKISILGQHTWCRPLDPSLDIWSDFVKRKRKATCLLFFFHFFLKRRNFFVCIFFLYSFKKCNFISLAYFIKFSNADLQYEFIRTFFYIPNTMI